MKSNLSAFLTIGLIVAASGISFFWTTPVTVIEGIIGDNIFVGAMLFTLLMFFSTVIAPITTLPIVPLVAPIFGPFITALLTIFGWTLGSVVAFLIARYAGKPLLEKFVSFEEIQAYEKYIPSHTQFLLIVTLRLIIPVDILSYAIGFFSNVPLHVYTLATAIGISWFAFMFSYMGDASINGNTEIFGTAVILSIIVFGLALTYVLKQVRNRGKK